MKSEPVLPRAALLALLSWCTAAGPLTPFALVVVEPGLLNQARQVELACVLLAGLLGFGLFLGLLLFAYTRITRRALDLSPENINRVLAAWTASWRRWVIFLVVTGVTVLLLIARRPLRESAAAQAGLALFLAALFGLTLLLFARHLRRVAAEEPDPEA